MRNLSKVEKQALIQERQILLQQSQERNLGVPSHIIEREIKQAIDKVRRRKK